MKVIKFSSELVPLILSGEKTSTWRLFDDKDLQPGDRIELFEFGANSSFAKGSIKTVIESKFKDLKQDDKVGHEAYESDREMYDTFSGYYKQKVGPETVVKIIHFEVVQ